MTKDAAPWHAATVTNTSTSRDRSDERLALASGHTSFLSNIIQNSFQDEHWAHASWDELSEPANPGVVTGSHGVIDNDVGKMLNIYVARRRGPILAALSRMNKRGPWILFPFGFVRATGLPLSPPNEDERLSPRVIGDHSWSLESPEHKV